jgi:hypothetical protein
MLIDNVRVGLFDQKDMQYYKDSYPVLDRQLKTANWFNLSDNVVTAVTRLLATRATDLEAYLEFARRPFSNMWIEFPVKARVDFLSSIGIEPIGKQPSRVGLLLDDHPKFPGDPLCGRALVFWRHQGRDDSEAAYAELQWDFRSSWTDWRNSKDQEEHAKLVLGKHNVAFVHRRSSGVVFDANPAKRGSSWFLGCNWQ